MSTEEQKPPEEDQEKLPPGKTFQIMLVQTAVFAVVFFAIIWLLEKQSAIAAAFGIAAIIYILMKRKSS